MEPPENYSIDDEINWDAPWVDVCLRVELPFWLMVDNITLPIEVCGHIFPVRVHGESFELHGRFVTDSKESVAYQGRFKQKEELSNEIQNVLREESRAEHSLAKMQDRFENIHTV